MTEPLALGSAVEVTRGQWSGLTGRVVDRRDIGDRRAYGVQLQGERYTLTFAEGALEALVEARGTAPAVGRALL